MTSHWIGNQHIGNVNKPALKPYSDDKENSNANTDNTILGAYKR